MKLSVALPAKRRSSEDSAILLISVAGMLLLLGQWLILPSYSSRPPAHWIIVPTLRVIDDQKRNWATEHHKQVGETPTAEDLAPYFQGGKFPSPVMGEIYHINPVGQQPTATTPPHFEVVGLTTVAGTVITMPDR